MTHAALNARRASVRYGLFITHRPSARRFRPVDSGSRMPPDCHAGRSLSIHKADFTAVGLRLIASTQLLQFVLLKGGLRQASRPHWAAARRTLVKQAKGASLQTSVPLNFVAFPSYVNTRCPTSSATHPSLVRPGFIRINPLPRLPPSQEPRSLNPSNC